MEACNWRSFGATNTWDESTLPTALKEFILYHPGRLAGSPPQTSSSLYSERKTLSQQSGTRSDLWFVDDSTGETLAEIRGLEMYVTSETPLLAGASADAL